MENMMRTSKKAQMEVLGLAVIVILMSLGMLFIVKFVILDPSTNTKASYTHTQMASNTLNSLLKTTTPCQGTDVTVLLKDYVTSARIQCENGTSGEQLEEIFDTVFNQTLDTWKKNYLFTVYMGDDYYFINENGNCTGLTQKQSETFPLPTERGTLFLTLDICS